LLLFRPSYAMAFATGTANAAVTILVVRFIVGTVASI
jgi:hypothetical protein